MQVGDLFYGSDYLLHIPYRTLMARISELKHKRRLVLILKSGLKVTKGFEIFYLSFVALDIAQTYTIQTKDGRLGTVTWGMGRCSLLWVSQI